LEVSESSTSLTGESHSDTTDADASVLDPTFTSCLVLVSGSSSISSGSGLLTFVSVQVMIAAADENAMSVSATPPLVVLS
jgi:hypothetical protein